MGLVLLIKQWVGGGWVAVGFCEGILEGKKSMARGVDWTAL